MRARKNQVSMPNPEFGVDFDASARAMHQSASKGSLMVHENTRSGAAAVGKSPKATMFERNTMLKTLKRHIALVAVSVLGASGLAVIAAPAANAATSTATAITASAVARVGGDLSVKVTATGSTSTDDVRYAALSLPAGASIATSSANDITAAGSVTITSSSDTITAGTYTLLVWLDANGDSTSAPDSDALATRVTFTAGGNPAALVATAAAVTGAKEDTSVAASVAISATLQDAAGVTTLAKSGETVSLGAMTTGASADTSVAVSSGATSAAKAVTHRGMGVYSARIGNSAAGTTTVAMAGSGLLTGSVPAITFTLSTFTVVDLSPADSSTIAFPAAQLGLSTSDTSLVAPAASYDTTGTTIYASTATAKTISFSVASPTSNAGGTVLSVIAERTAAKLPTGVTAATTRVTLDAAGDATVTVAATAPTAGQDYTITIGKIAFNIVYVAPIPVTLEMGPNAALSSVVGGSTTITATATDQFGDAYAGALVTFSINGSTSRAGADNKVVGSGSTNADGVATMSITDVSTAALTSKNTDVIDASAQYIGGASAVNSTGSVTITYVTALTVETVAVAPATSGTNANLDTTTLGTVAAPYLAIANLQRYKATVTSATGAPISGIPVVFTVTNGVLSNVTQSKTKTVYTTSGVAEIDLIPTTTGKVTVTAVAGGKTGTSDTVTIGNAAAADARSIALDAATYAVAGGELKRVKATVTDRFGNGVKSVSVTFSTTAGRFAGGALTVTGTTGADGVAVADLSPMANDPAATGTLTASFTATDASTSTTRADGLAYPAKKESATATVTTTAASSASASNPALDAVKTDVKAVSDTVATLSKAVTTIQSSVTELTSTFSAQIKSLSSAIAKISRAIAALSKRIK